MNKRNTPPRWLERLLDALLNPRTAEAVMGDLYEKYYRRVEHGKPQLARILFVWEGLGFLRLAKRFPTPFPKTAMIKNYLTIAWRNFSREKTYSSLNILGLSIGLATAVALFILIRFELSYDQFHVNHERLYRITEDFQNDTGMLQSAYNHSPVAAIMQENLPEVKRIIRVFPYSQFRASFVSVSPNEKFREERFCFADSNFFQSFSFRPLEGELAHSLNAPFQVVITESMAIKYYGTTQNLLGKQLVFENESRQYTFYISGVIENIPQTSHFAPDFLASMASLEAIMPNFDNWHYPSTYLYVETNLPVDVTAWERKLNSTITKWQPDYVKEEKRQYHVQPITSIHLNSHLANEWEANSRMSYIQLYALAGGFILIIAIINFVNMATARASRRAKEVGMRKAFGVPRTQLVFQFLFEALLHTMVAFVMGIALAELLLHYGSVSILGKDISIFSYFTWESLLPALLFVAACALLSGLYPAFYLSGFRPMEVLKGKMHMHTGSANLRKYLVTFQFLISGVLIAATTVIFLQMQYIRSADLGFDKHGQAVIRLTDRFASQNYQQLKEKLKTEPGVVAVGLSAAVPGGSSFHDFEIKPEGTTDSNGKSIKTLGVDESFLTTLNVLFTEGRNFSEEVSTDQESAFILNEAAVNMLGWKEATGKQLEITFYIGDAIIRKGTVIGVVADFNFSSLYEKIEPLLIYVNKHPFFADYLTVRFEHSDPARISSILHKHWKDFHPDKPLEFDFLDEQLAHLYESEQKTSRVLYALAILSVVTSCLGLFGLSAYMAEKRTKEAGIRKVLGASDIQVMTLQLREFLMLLMIANALLVPLVWWWANQWLNSFAYHTKLNPLIFVATFVIMVSMVVITLLYYSVKVGRTNPVDSLRYE